MIPAAGIAIVAFSDNVLTARTFAARQGQRVDANAELRALGVCNVGTGLLHGFPVSSSGSRTALGDAVGSRTQLYSVVTLVFVLLVMVAGRGVLANFPMAALGALVVYAALRLIDVPEFKRLARFRRSELILALATTASVLVFGVLYGVLVAIVLSILDLLRRVARPHDAVLGFVPGVAGMHDVDDYPEADPVARAGGLPLRRAAVLRQRRELPRTGDGGGRRRTRTRSSGSCSTPRRTWRSTSPHWTPSISCAPNWQAAE